MPPNLATVSATAFVDALLVADVAGQRQRLAAGLLDLLGGGEDRAGQPRIGLHGLGRDGDVGAVARGAQRDGKSDAPAGAGHEQGLATQAHGVPKNTSAL